MSQQDKGHRFPCRPNTQKESLRVWFQSCWRFIVGFRLMRGLSWGLNLGVEGVGRGIVLDLGLGLFGVWV